MPTTGEEPAESSRLSALQARADELDARYGFRHPEVRKARQEVADAYRDSLRQQGKPYTAPVDVGVRTWIYGDPVVIQTEGAAILIALPERDDEDQRLLVFRWQGCAGAFIGPPSDEGRHLLPLPEPLVHEWYVTTGIAEVFNSPWLSWWLGWASTPGRYRHFSILFQDSVFHAFARSVSVERLQLRSSELGPLLSDPGVLEQLTRREFPSALSPSDPGPQSPVE